jgi:peptidyl-prolyl cis-trans isomerase B (cyclophilin B)
MTVKGGQIRIKVDGTKAPITAGNFVDLVQKGVYNGTVFHRVVKEPQPFVVQGGDPQSKDPAISADLYGTGSYIDPKTKEPRYVPLEIMPVEAKEPVYSRTFQSAGISKPPQLRHNRGAIAMARSQFPDSASAQFYFTLGDVNFLDGDYAVFGTVIEGMEIVDQIQQGDVIEKAEVIEGADKLKQPGGASTSADTATPGTEAEATPAESTTPTTEPTP